jgi:hypothetical protein
MDSLFAFFLHNVNKRLVISTEDVEERVYERQPVEPDSSLRQLFNNNLEGYVGCYFLGQVLAVREVADLLNKDLEELQILI